MSKPAKKKNTKRTKPAKPKTGKPRILVMEAAGGAATNAVMRAGAQPVRVSPRDLNAVDEALAAGFDGLLLTGGGDVDPRLYGEKPHKEVYGVSETRDYTDWMALERAYELGVPVMGICRGMQLIAIHNGGALKQHVTGHRGGSHLVWSDSGSRFRRTTRAEHAAFPSLHHQIVRRHGGKGMVVSGRSKEGYIEVIERTGARGVSPVLAVQFHPEYDYGTNEASRRLLDWLATASARRAGLPKPTRAKVQQPRHGLLGQSSQMSMGFSSARTRPRLPRTVETRFFCRDCLMEFDKKQDRDDHEVWVCGSGHTRTTEPPPGHPDWMGDDATCDCGHWVLASPCPECGS